MPMAGNKTPVSSIRKISVLRHLQGSILPERPSISTLLSASFVPETVPCILEIQIDLIEANRSACAHKKRGPNGPLGKSGQ
jgi:hypothetical protein